MSAPSVSVIIPTYKDWDRLQLCVEALRRQTLAKDTYRIIVVDNDAETLAPHLRPQGVTYVHEPRGHSYAARNAGIDATSASILAFTDADCIPEPDWLERGLVALESGQADVVGGEIRMFATHNSVAARYDLAYGLQQARFFATWGGFATANLFVRRQVIGHVGPFRADLESGGDFEFSQRAQRAGFRLAFAPDAVVRHPARHTMRQLFSQSARTARGVIEYCYKRDCANVRDAWPRALRQLRPRPRDYYYALRGGRGSEALPWRHRPATTLVRIVMQYQFAWSLISALRRSSKSGGWQRE